MRELLAEGGLLTVWLIFWNVAAFVLYGYDKMQAKRDRRRIPEKTLFLVALVGGSAGALAGMYQFRHKTRHWQFRLGLPAILVCHLVLAGWLLGLF
ncbi:MAG: DUF1294 domain-containing protein [Ruminococcaceae bacterium]|nr:DUF1294 domain-containing protein [Oscillospiraceae bacterium]